MVLHFFCFYVRDHALVCISVINHMFDMMLLRILLKRENIILIGFMKHPSQSRNFYFCFAAHLIFLLLFIFINLNPSIPLYFVFNINKSMNTCDIIIFYENKKKTTRITYHTVVTTLELIKSLMLYDRFY